MGYRSPLSPSWRLPARHAQHGTPSRLKACEVCAGAGEEIHHVRPRASGGPDTARNTCTLCTRCHELAHEVFGPGDDYHGPLERCEFLNAMKIELWLAGQ